MHDWLLPYYQSKLQFYKFYYTFFFYHNITKGWVSIPIPPRRFTTTRRSMSWTNPDDPVRPYHANSHVVCVYSVRGGFKISITISAIDWVRRKRPRHFRRHTSQTIFFVVVIFFSTYDPIYSTFFTFWYHRFL